MPCIFSGIKSVSVVSYEGGTLILERPVHIDPKTHENGNLLKECEAKSPKENDENRRESLNDQ